MKNSFKKQYFWLLIIIAISLTGCLRPYNPAKWAAVVIFNDTNASLSYQLKLSGNLTSPVKIEVGMFDYVLEYDQIKNDDTIDNQLTEIILQQSGCLIRLVRADMLKIISKDPDGRNTWDLHVNEELIKQFTCMKN